MAFDVDWDRPPGQRITGLSDQRVPAPRQPEQQRRPDVSTYQALPPVRPAGGPALAALDESAQIAENLARGIDQIRADLRTLIQRAIAALDELDTPQVPQ